MKDRYQKKHKTITQKIRKGRDIDSIEDNLSRWHDSWCADQCRLIDELEQAVLDENQGEAMKVVVVMRAMTDKRFTAMGNVFEALCEKLRVKRDSESGDSGDNEDGSIDYVNDAAKDLTDGAVNQITDNPVENSTDGAVKNPAKRDYKRDSNSYSYADKPLLSAEDIDSKTIKHRKIEDIGNLYLSGMSVRGLAKEYEISEEKVIKLLVTQGVYSSDMYDRIKILRESGMSDAEIINRVKISEKAFQRYIPYKKGVYNVDVPSANALNLRKWKKKWQDAGNKGRM